MRETCKPPGAVQEEAMSGGTEGTFHAIAVLLCVSVHCTLSCNVVSL